MQRPNTDTPTEPQVNPVVKGPSAGETATNLQEYMSKINEDSEVKNRPFDRYKGELGDGAKGMMIPSINADPITLETINGIYELIPQLIADLNLEENDKLTDDQKQLFKRGYVFKVFNQRLAEIRNNAAKLREESIKELKLEQAKPVDQQNPELIGKLINNQVKAAEETNKVNKLSVAVQLIAAEYINGRNAKECLENLLDKKLVKSIAQGIRETDFVLSKQDEQMLEKNNVDMIRFLGKLTSYTSIGETMINAALGTDASRRGNSEANRSNLTTIKSALIDIWSNSCLQIEKTKEFTTHAGYVKAMRDNLIIGSTEAKDFKEIASIATIMGDLQTKCFKGLLTYKKESVFLNNKDKDLLKKISLDCADILKQYPDKTPDQVRQATIDYLKSKAKELPRTSRIRAELNNACKKLENDKKEILIVVDTSKPKAPIIEPKREDKPSKLQAFREAIDKLRKPRTVVPQEEKRARSNAVVEKPEKINIINSIRKMISR